MTREILNGNENEKSSHQTAGSLFSGFPSLQVHRNFFNASDILKY